MAVERGLMQGGYPEEELLPELAIPVDDLGPDFSQGAEVSLAEDGSALVQPSGLEDEVVVDAGVYEHNANLAEALESGAMASVASDLLASYKDDLISRAPWEKVYEKGLELLGQDIEAEENRSEPFEGASGVTHPILVEAATAFQAQAYKELLPAGGPVDTAIKGLKTIEIEKQASRIKEFMNYQITEVMEDYDPGMDQMLGFLPLAGSTFKKVYYDAGCNEPRSDFLPAQDLVVPYGTVHLRKAPRATHRLSMTDNEVKKLQLSGFYRDVELPEGADTTEPDKVDDKTDETAGQEKGHLGENRLLLEMHAEVDLEGFEDRDGLGEPTGLKLPYIITIDYATSKVLAIRRNWKENDPYRKKRDFFVHYKFMPGLGFYGFGFFHILGGLGRASTAILRQLIDAGTLANLPGGFKAKGLRVRDEDEPINPGEFREIDVPGGNIRDAVIPLPYKEPSQTLNLLLGSLVEAGRRLTSISDPNTHDVNSQAPVGTTVALLERGTRVMSAIHKRLHRAQKIEFKLLAAVFAENLPQEYPYQVEGAPQSIMAQDFDGRVDIIPISDPNIFSMSQRIALAQNSLQIAQSNPELHNLHEAYKRMYLALGVADVDGLLPPPPPPPPPMDPAQENAALVGGTNPAVFPEQNHESHIINHIALAEVALMGQSPAATGSLLAHCLSHVSHMARKKVEEENRRVQEEVLPQMQQEMQNNAQQMQLAVQMGAIPPEQAQQNMAAMQQQMQSVQTGVSPEETESRVAEAQEELTRWVIDKLSSVNPQMDDPLVAIRQRELDLRAEKQENDESKDEQRIALDKRKLTQQAAEALARIESSEEIAEDRDATNRERIAVQREGLRRRTSGN